MKWEIFMPTFKLALFVMCPICQSVLIDNRNQLVVAKMYRDKYSHDVTLEYLWAEVER